MRLALASLAGFLGPLGTAFGGGIVQALAEYQSTCAQRQFQAFSERIRSIEETLHARPDAVSYAQTPEGQERALKVFAHVVTTRDPAHAEMLANAFVSGVALGGDSPTLVDVFDDAVSQLSLAHIRILRVAAHDPTQQSENGLAARLVKPVHIGRLTIEGGMVGAGAVAQKLTVDLVRQGVFQSAQKTQTGGVDWVAITDFGLLLCKYLTEPDAFHADAPPRMTLQMPRGVSTDF